MIERKELKYIGFALAFAFVWMVFVIPSLEGKSFMSNPIMPFLVFNVGVFIIIQIIFKGVVLGNMVGVREMLGLISIANSLDLFFPPFVLNTLGQLNDSVFLAPASSDYVIATLWMHFGLHGFYLYVATYVLSPVILLIISAFLLKNFVRRL